VDGFDQPLSKVCEIFNAAGGEVLSVELVEDGRRVLFGSDDSLSCESTKDQVHPFGARSITDELRDAPARQGFVCSSENLKHGAMHAGDHRFDSIREVHASSSRLCSLVHMWVVTYLYV
jgi:hypothetical protein